MTPRLTDDLIGQIEIFDALELKAAEEYAVMENELANAEFKEIIGRIRVEELYHSKLCKEIITFLKNRAIA